MEFFQRHIIAGIGLLLGPAIAIGSLILHAVALHEMGLPLEIWVSFGLGIFFLSVIGILMKWDEFAVSNSNNQASGTAQQILHQKPRASESNPAFEQFRGYYRNHTRAEGDRLIAPHIGRELEITGTVHDVSINREFGTALVWLEDEPSSTVLHFEKEETPTVQIIHRGEKITVRGKLLEADDYKIALRDCSLLSRHPSS